MVELTGKTITGREAEILNEHFARDVNELVE